MSLYVVGPFFFFAWISNGGMFADERTITQVLTHYVPEVWAAVTAISEIRPIALLLSCTSVFPVLLIISIIITVCIVCLIVSSVKVAVLGEIYGVVAITGSTYLFGFITTIITCTWFVFSVVQMVL
jgi:hypothetical protein